METKQTAFRLGLNTLEQLEFLRIELHKKDRTDTIKAVIQETYDRYTLTDTVTTDGDTDGNTTDNPEYISIPTSLLDTLNEQLAVKDGQIAALNQTLIKAQDSNTELTRSLQAAQTLNAMDKPQTQPAAILEQSNETGPTAQPPIGNMTFRQMFSHWREARKRTKQ